jgi:membrane-associated phospholipid phosphatase
MIRKLKQSTAYVCCLYVYFNMKSIACYFVILCFPLTVQAQKLDSLGNTRSPTIKPYIIPAVFISYGLVSLSNNSPVRDLDKSLSKEITKRSPTSFTSIDDILRYVPAAAVYGLNLAGIKGKHSLIDATGIYVLSTGISGVTALSIKNIADRPRPDGSDNHSFPSGHATSAFASAEFLKQEYKDVSPIYGYAGYSVATATAVLRLYNKKHWLSDVVMGAGIGILSTKVAYLIYPEIKQAIFGKQSANYTLIPSYGQKTFGISFSAALR